MHQKRLVGLQTRYEDGYKSRSVSLRCLPLKAPPLGKTFPAGLTDLEAELLFSKRKGLTQISPQLSEKDTTVRSHT